MTSFRLFLLALAAALPLVAQAFNPNANDNVYASAIQSDGRILLGGAFTTVQPSGLGVPVARQRLARFQADGTLDTTFSPAFNGDVTTVVLQADGRILVGGKFTQVTSTGGTAAVTRTGLARLEADGKVDLTFDPRPTGGSAALGQISSIAIDTAGNILIGGAFTSLQPGGSGTTYARSRLARLAPSGAVDTAFSPAFNNLVTSITVQPDGRVLVGGGFTTVQSTGATSATSVSRLVRLTTGGAIDTTFTASLNNRVNVLALEADGSVLVGGDFTAVTGSTDASAVAHNFLVRLKSTGQRDADFVPRPSAAVSEIRVQRDGKILLGGEFTSFYSANTGAGRTANYLARLNRDGSVDTDFAPAANALVSTIALQNDGRIVVGGLFSRFTPTGASSSVLRSHAARLQASGDLDGAFSSDEDGAVLTAVVDSSGRLIVGGQFSSYVGLTRGSLARILADGSIDPTFAPVIDGAVLALAFQSDGKLLVGGSFNFVNSVEVKNLVRLNTDGSLDTSFKPGPSSVVYAILPQSDGRILVGGDFYAWDTDDGQNDDDDGDGITTDDTVRPYLAQIDSAGKVTSLDWGVDGTVTSLAAQSDGKVMLAGNFTSVKGTIQPFVARLNSAGELDGTFKPGLNGEVRSIAVQSDGKVILGGTFTTAQLDDGQNDDDDEDTITDDDADRERLIRLNADGTLDKTYNPVVNAAVAALRVLADNRLVLAGSFTQIGATPVSRRYVAVLGTDGKLDATNTLQTNDRASVIAAGSDGKVYVAGRFTTAFTAAGESIATAGHVIRLLSTGGLEATWAVRASNPNGARVLALAQQADGKVVVGGEFTEFAGQDSKHLTRLTSAGYPDTSWTTGTDAAVRALAVQPLVATAVSKVNLLAWFESNGTSRTSFDRRDISDLNGRINAVLPLADGSLLVGGAFTVTGSTLKHLVRFQANGTLDRNFNLQLNSSVAALGRQATGKIIVGGAFTSAGGATRNFVLRLNTDLTIDTNFTPPAANGSVAALVVQSDDAIVIGGSFTSFELDDGQNDDDDNDGVSNDDTGRRYIARLSAGGTLDTAYDPSANSTVAALLLLPDGRVIAGGAFTSFTPNRSATSITRNFAALINTDATINESFAPEPNGAVAALARQSDGKILLGGYFSVLQLDDGQNDDDDNDTTLTDDADRNGIARLNADYTLDRTFNPTPNGAVLTLAVHPDGRIIIGGAFTTLEPVAKQPITRRYVAALTAAGTISTNFNPAATAGVYTATVLPDGSFIIAGAFDNLLADPVLYVGGDFATVGGLDLPRLARLTADGSTDGGFRPAPNGAVHALAVDADGGILVGGAFTSLSGSARTRLARYTVAGVLDAAYAPQFDGTVRALALGSAGRLYVGGDFTTAGGSARAGLARLLSSGGLDTAFTAQVEGSVLALAVQPDGRVLLGGDFSKVNGQTRRHLARLNADGTLDAAFDPAPSAPVRALTARVDGSVIVGGDFTSIAGVNRARLALLKADGSLDTSLSADANASVHALTGLLDGRALVGGAFTTVGSAADYLISRVGGSSSGAYSFTVASGRQSATWNLSGPAPAFASVGLSYSTNGNLWNSLGAATPSADGKTWQWSGATALPADTPYLLRARAVVPASGGGTQGLVEVSWQFVNSVAAGEITVGTPSGGGTGGSGGTGGGSGSGSGSGTGSITLSGPIYSATVNATSAGYLSDFSSLLRLRASEIKFVNFVISGGSARRVFIRAAGPGLSSINIADRIPSPRLEVYTSAGALWASAAGPVSDASLVTLVTQVGALPLTNGSGDAALVTTLQPGSYVVAVWDAAGTAGAVMTEIFAADSTVPAGLVAMASRATAAANTGVQSVEFTIKGTAARNVLVRALGPALATQGVTGANTNPTLILQNSTGATIASNDDWETPVAGTQTASTGAQLASVASNVGAAALATGSRDSALLVSLNPGSYTAAVTGSGSAAGITEIEVFDVPVITTDTTTGTSSGTTTTTTSSGGGGGGSPTAVGGALLGALLLARALRRGVRPELN